MFKMSAILQWDSRLLKLSTAVFSFIFLLSVAAVDFITGYETAVSLLYLLPVFLAVWFSWRFAAILAAILSGLSDITFNYFSGRPYSAINTLNSLTQLVIFVVLAYALLALKKSQASLRSLSRTDPLTELVNSKYFFELGSAEIQRSLRYKHPFSLVYIDIDNFKSVNDNMGHSSGDALLRDIAKRVKNTIRVTDTMARLGGDEFAILLPETAGSDAVNGAVYRIQNTLLTTKASGGMPVTFSIGVVTNDCRMCAFDEVIKAADSLMYEAKRSGKNTVRIGILGDK